MDQISTVGLDHFRTVGNKMLEEHVGTQLFMRTTRTVNLTLAGRHFLEHCRQWLSWIDAMPNELQQINAGVETHVNIVVNNLFYQPPVAASLSDTGNCDEISVSR